MCKHVSDPFFASDSEVMFFDDKDIIDEISTCADEDVNANHDGNFEKHLVLRVPKHTIALFTRLVNPEHVDKGDVRLSLNPDNRSGKMMVGNKTFDFEICNIATIVEVLITSLRS